MIKKCIVCGKEFETKSDNVVCCKECKKAIIAGKCAECGKEFKCSGLAYASKIKKFGKAVCSLCSSKITCFEKYGAENVMQKKEISSKSADTRKKLFSKEDYISKSNNTKIAKNGTLENAKEKANKKRIETCLKKYGVEYSSKTKEAVEKQKESLEKKYGKNWKEERIEALKTFMLEKYGVDNPFKDDGIKNKIKETLAEKYGVDNARKIKGADEKIKKTCTEKYGGIGFSSKVLREKAQQKYLYDGKYFDSSWEIYMYIYCTDNNIKFSYHPDISFKYSGHAYQPDFIINDEIIEIKGPQFFDGEKMINPFDRSMDILYEEKHQCMIENKVKIITDISKEKEYVEKKYTKDFVPLFKCGIPFPYPNRNFNDHSDLGLIHFFHKSIYEANVAGRPSPVQAWEDKDIIRKTALNRIKYTGRCTPDDILQGFSVMMNAKKVSVFSPYLSTELIKEYLAESNEIFDPFSGFSGRMIGTYNNGKKYIGQDINEKHIEESRKLAEFKGINAVLKVQDILSDSDKEFDSLFTCPPYSAKENWNQKIENKTCDEWIDVCLEKYNCKRYLFVVDDTSKYKGSIVRELENKSHFGKNHEYVVLLTK